MSDSVRPHGRQPSRLLHPWDSPGKNTGVGCHFLFQRMKVKSESEVAQSYPTPSDPMDCSPPGSSIHGIFQARVLEWGAIAFSALLFTWGQTMVEVMKIMVTSFKNPMHVLLHSVPPTLQQATTDPCLLWRLLHSRNITLPTKVHLVKAMVFPVVMYGCESWTIKKASIFQMMLLNCNVGEDS